MKKKSIIIVIFVLFVLLMLTLAFYSIPFVESNQLIVFANKTGAEGEFEDSCITEENYKKMYILKREISENEYIRFKTVPKFKLLGVTKIMIMCDVKAMIYSLDDLSINDTYNDKLNITFEFVNDRWSVINVE